MRSRTVLLKLLTEEARDQQGRILMAVALSGIANAGVIAIVNQAARSPGKSSALLFILFVLACTVYSLCLRYSVGAVSTLIEAVIYKIRVRVADTLRRAELRDLEQIGLSEIYERLSQQTEMISQSAWPMAASLQSGVMVVFMSLYLLLLSPGAFLLAAVIYVAGSFRFHSRNLKAQEVMQEAAEIQMSLFDRLTDMLRGFKELRFRGQRGKDIYKDYQGVAAQLRRRTIESNVLNEGNYIFANLNQFVVLAAITFVLPQFISGHTKVLTNVVGTLLFMFGAIQGLLWALPQYGRANMAAENIRELEQKLARAADQPSGDGLLDSSLRAPPAGPQQSGSDEAIASYDPWNGSFREIRVEEVQFQYGASSGHDSFGVGPLSLTLRAGEIVFIVGGNGSGKSTLVKVLTALYAPHQGTLRVDDVPLAPANVQAYREMIAAIFGDFHLFKKLYGLPEVTEEDVQRLLEKMQIGSKVSLMGRTLSTLELSTGQRKRLAMVIALLEDRPIYVLDEWASDQDPEFRRFYYEELLQELKRRGKTVIAISHDDRYFHCADRVLTMEYGRIRSIEIPGSPIAPERAAPLEIGRHGAS